MVIELSEQRGHQPYVRLLGGPRHRLILAEIHLTTENLTGYRKTAETEQYETVGPRGGKKAYTLAVWRYV